MVEYIEREAVIKQLNDIAIEYIKDNSIQCNIAAGTIIDIRDSVILKAPALDVAEIKSETIKEFAERLKKTQVKSYWNEYEIDKLVKEMVGIK